MLPVVISVDVGRRNTKYIIKPGTPPDCCHFPSVTQVSDGTSESDPATNGRDTVTIPVDGLYYEVGPEISLAADIFNAEVLQHDNFCHTPEYTALTLGALAYAKQPVVDLLVIGLPVSTYKLKKDRTALEKRFTGIHKLNKNRTVEVKRVAVVSQPSGALMYFGLQEDIVADIRKKSTMSLILDCGRRTFDWICTEGMTPLANRSHSVNRGMFDVLQKIANAISNATKSEYRNYDAIDDALRKNTPLTLYQKEYSLKRHLEIARKVPEQAVAEMLAYIGNPSDIKYIVLVGGASFFYQNAVQKAFPRHKISTVDRPMYATVLGFQIAGELLMKANGSAKVAAEETAKAERNGGEQT